MLNREEQSHSKKTPKPSSGAENRSKTTTNKYQMCNLTAQLHQLGCL